MDLDSSQLRCFLEVAEQGTVAAAANSLGYSPPAVSQKLAKLEDNLDTVLFDRVGGRLRLNDSGKSLRPRAFDVLDAGERARTSVAEPLARVAPIVIAGFPSSLAYIVTPALGRRIGQPGSGSIRVRESEDNESQRDLSLGHVDIAIIQEYGHLSYTRNDRFRYQLIATDPVRLITPKSWDLSPTSLCQLADVAWIVSTPGSPCRPASMRACTDAGFDPIISAEVAEHSTTRELVAAGAGVALVPELALVVPHPDISVSPIETGIVRQIYAVTREASGSSPDLADLIAAITSNEESLLKLPVIGKPVSN